jgi:flagellar operon protein
MSDTLINGVQVPFLPARGVEGLKEQPPVGPARDGAFDEVLAREMNDLRFSKHAQDRIASRNIRLSDSDLATLSGAVTRAGEKGGQDSLVLLRDMAFIISVPSRTVVTAMDAAGMKENVFTNIDSAVIAG